MLIRARLAGPCPLYRELTGPAAQENLEALSHELTGSLRALDLTVHAGDVVRPLSVEAWRDQPHMLSEMLAMADEALDDDAVLYALLAELPPDVGLYGGQGRTAAELREYVRTLLPELPARVCDQMVKEDE